MFMLLHGCVCYIGHERTVCAFLIHWSWGANDAKTSCTIEHCQNLSSNIEYIYQITLQLLSQKTSIVEISDGYFISYLDSIKIFIDFYSHSIFSVINHHTSQCKTWMPNLLFRDKLKEFRILIKSFFYIGHWIHDKRTGTSCEKHNNLHCNYFSAIIE